MDALAEPVGAVDAVAWRFALEGAKARLAGLASSGGADSCTVSAPGMAVGRLA